MKDQPIPIPPPSVRPGPHVLIVGGGASGVLMAVHLLSRTERAFRVTIVEQGPMLGCGVAYSTTDPDHLLNTRVHNMSAFPDAPDHFHRWLAARPDGAEATGDCFVGRATYGAYLGALLAPWLAGNGPCRLRCVRQSCVALEETPRGVVARLADGQALVGEQAILATGHVQPDPDADGVVSGPWRAMPTVDRDGTVVIVGSGLTMVDQVLTLLRAGHRGPIVSVSRRGQLPRAHRPTKPLTLSRADVPLGAPVSALMRWVRRLARQAEAQGGTWRDAVDGVRPHVRAIWRGLPVAERARFLRHAATWWDVHRHRIPPSSATVIAAARARGHLVLHRGAFLGAARRPDGRLVARCRAGGLDQDIACDRILDCRGIRRDPVAHATPLAADLLARGAARVDPLRIGFDVTQDCRLVRRDGRPSDRLRAIGPASRAAFWEITAIPDIREQTAALAFDLASAQIPA